MFSKIELRFGALAASLLVCGLWGSGASAAAWISVTGMTRARAGHTATLLADGEVLVVGGTDANPQSSAEIFDPSSGIWSPTSAMSVARSGAAALLLPNGTVLVAGGGSTAENSTQIYDPEAEDWDPLHTLPDDCPQPTLTLLKDGSALLVCPTPQIYHPDLQTFSSAGTLPAMTPYTATLLPSGEVLVTGIDASSSAVAYLFDPSNDSWTPTSTSSSVCDTTTLLHTGEVLCVPLTGMSAPGALPQLFDPTTKLWSSTGPNLFDHNSSTATLLSGGDVLVVGSAGSSTGAELYDPATNSWGDALLDGAQLSGQTATLLPNGRVLLVGGASGGAALDTVKELDPGYGEWLSTGNLASPVRRAEAIELPSGRALVFGGDNTTGPTNAAARFDPSTGTWLATAPLPSPLFDTASALLQDGRVLVTGGDPSNPLAEIYAEGTNLWTPTANMRMARQDHTAVTLPDGRVLIIGGDQGQTTQSTKSTAIFDPSTNGFLSAAPMSQPRSHAAAVVLPSSSGPLAGDVLVCGGVDQECDGFGNCNYTALKSCAIYDPVDTTWTPAGSMGTARYYPFLFVLPNGKVLAMTRQTGDTSTELYDPTLDSWTPSPNPMPTGHSRATQLPDGRVLAAGGVISTETDLYDWQTDTWTAVGNLPVMASEQTLVPVNGDLGWVVIAGGFVSTGGQTLSSAELWAPPVDTSAWAPAIDLPGTAAPISTVTLTGSKFRGGTEATGGSSQSSPTDYPIMTLQSIGGGTVYPLPFSDFSDTTATFKLPSAVGEGAYTLTMTVNGISSSVPLNVDALPVANDQTVNAVENTATSITLDATDADGDPLTYSIANGPSTGTLSAINNDTVTYTPNDGFYGSDSFTFQAYDGHEYSNVATVTLNVDAPPVAQDQSVTVNENGSVSITLVATDADGGPNPLTYRAGRPSHGVLSGTGPNLTYTPNAGYAGPDSFTFVATDGVAGSNFATVSLTVTAPGAADQSVTVNENGSVPVTLVGTDTDDDTLTYSIVTPPSFGTLSGTAPNLTYTPNAGYFGADFFTFKVNDGLADSNTALVDIIVGHVNQLPTASAQSVTTAEDTSVAITLSGTDPESDTFTYQIATPPSHGALSGSAPNLVYTPDPDFNGSDDFTFVINDGAADSQPAKVSITVTPVNDAPVALAQRVAGTGGTSIPILLSATNLDGDPLTYAVVTQPTHGTLSGTAPSLTYTSEAGYIGADSFTFQVSDGQVTSAPACVDISTRAATTSAPTPPTLLFPSATDQLPAGKVTFGWRPSVEADGGAVHYHIEASRDGKVVFSNETDQTSMTSDVLEAGSYTWHVIALNVQGDASAPSENRSLTLIPVKASGGVGCSTAPGQGSPWSGLLVVMGALGLVGFRRRGWETK